MRDIDVRQAVHAKILKEHHRDPNTLVIDEFSLGLGASRADITVINGIMHGYELKSKSDNLTRLPSQINYYSSVMDKVTLVVDESHQHEAAKLIPEWWGIKVVTQGKRKAIHLETRRANRFNPEYDKISLAMLLWKDEILSILRDVGLEHGLKSKPKRILWNKLAEVFKTDELRQIVREKIKSRINWRVAQ